MVAPWLPYEPLRTYPLRSPQNYEDALRQFDVENSLRYKPWVGSDPNATYCNIFLWDGLRALGIDNPSHWVDALGRAAIHHSKGARELTANATCDWFHAVGQDYGWRRVDGQVADARVIAGFPVVLAWKNTGGGSGHVAFLLPGGRVIQAGRKNGTMTIKQAFGDKLYICWTHD